MKTNRPDWDPIEVWQVEEQLKADAHHFRTAALSCLTSDEVRGVDSTLEHNQWPKHKRPGVLTRAFRSGSVALPPEAARVQLARVINNLGVLFLVAGTYVDALYALRQGEQLFRKTLPAENRNLGGLLNNLAYAILEDAKSVDASFPALSAELRAESAKCSREAASLGYP